MANDTRPAHIMLNHVFLASGGLKWKRMPIEIKDWIAAAAIVFVSLPTLAISARTLRLTEKNRNSIHRDQLYKKQIEAYEKIFALFTPFHEDCFNVTWQPRNPDDFPHNIPSMVEVSRNFSERIIDTGKYDDLRLAFRQAAFYLPTEFQEAMSHYMTASGNIARAVTMNHVEADKARSQLQSDLNKSYNKVVEAARHSIAAEPLSADILAVSEPKPRRKE
jgi:hypothetical protein